MCSKPGLTICTATYNRAYILGKAYESLKKQTNKNFEWIIADDGSTDGTESLVQDWLKEDPGFPIVYTRLEHAGLPNAINSGVKLAKSEWFMRLDSDDAIVPETVEKALVWIKEIELEPHFAGIGFARFQPDGSYMKDQIPIIDEKLGYIDATHIERKKYHLDMDMCEVQRVSLLKRYPSRCWPGEFFAPEQINFYEMAMDGFLLRWRPEKLYLCDYRNDGLTKNDRIVKNNPMGYAMMYNQNILFSKTLREKCRNVIRMTALAIYGKHPEYVLRSNAKGLAILTFPLGAALSLRRKRQYRKLG